jgi:DNA-binding MarR family transcriptional regulator
MVEAALEEDTEQTRIMLNLLDSVEKDGAQSQRRLAAELGIALGLVNAYIKRCVKKGLLKTSEAPARRYIYYLTPKGFAEKSRLTVGYLSYSFGFFRQAKDDCGKILTAARASGFARVALAGKSDLAEIAAICALETGVEIIGVVDGGANGERFVGLPLARQFDELTSEPDAVVITDLLSPQRTCERVIARYGAERVLIPNLLRIRLRKSTGRDV